MILGNGLSIMKKSNSRKFNIVEWSEVDKDKLKQVINKVDRLKDISKGTRVFIKPNFTFPFFKPGVTTPPDFIRALVEVLIDRGAEIVIGEGGASLDVFNIQDSFADHGLYDLQKEYGIKVKHLRDEKVAYLDFGKKGAARNVPIPKILLDKTDLFITLPVAKVHAMTGVSLGFKNQWGCIAAHKRFIFHPEFNKILAGLHRLLPETLAICDGRFVLTDNGPMFGTTKRGTFLSAANDVGAFDVAMCHLMGIGPLSIKHIAFMVKENLAPISLKEIEFNDNLKKFRPCEFRLKRTYQNYIALAGFHSSTLTKIGYDSFLSGFIHKILYAIKPNPLYKEMKERQIINTEIET